MGDSIQYWREAKASLGAALIAESVVLPIDTVKIAIQTAPPGLRPGIAATTRDLWRTGGWSAFYRAWPPAVVRQMAFTSIRFGSYSQMTPWLKTQKSQVWLPMLTAARASERTATRGRPPRVQRPELPLDRPSSEPAATCGASRRSPCGSAARSGRLFLRRWSGQRSKAPACPTVPST